MIITNLHRAVTFPKYKTQRSGDLGADGYGWVWQANCGAHFILVSIESRIMTGSIDEFGQDRLKNLHEIKTHLGFSNSSFLSTFFFRLFLISQVRALLPALRSSPYFTPSRIIWTGSIEAMERFYITTDPQCLDEKLTTNAYESTKYQCELAAIGLDKVLQGQERMATQPGTPASERLVGSLSREASDSSSNNDERVKLGCGEPRSFIVHPGVVASSIFVEFLYWWMIEAMRLAFYIVS